jgi:hypothetical protein
MFQPCRGGGAFKPLDGAFNPGVGAFKPTCFNPVGAVVRLNRWMALFQPGVSAYKPILTKETGVRLGVLVLTPASAIVNKRLDRQSSCTQLKQFVG